MENISRSIGPVEEDTFVENAKDGSGQTIKQMLRWMLILALSCFVAISSASAQEGQQFEDLRLFDYDGNQIRVFPGISTWLGNRIIGPDGSTWIEISENFVRGPQGLSVPSGAVIVETNFAYEVREPQIYGPDGGLLFSSNNSVFVDGGSIYGPTGELIATFDNSLTINGGTISAPSGSVIIDGGFNAYVNGPDIGGGGVNVNVNAGRDFYLDIPDVTLPTVNINIDLLAFADEFLDKIFGSNEADGEDANSIPVWGGDSGNATKGALMAARRRLGSGVENYEGSSPHTRPDPWMEYAPTDSTQATLVDTDGDGVPDSTAGGLAGGFDEEGNPVSEGTPNTNAAIQGKHIEFGFNRLNTDKSLKMIDISVDDEIFKLSFPQYLPLPWMQEDYLNNMSERDRYLNIFQKQRGVAVLTLKYLDNTVATGLAGIQQHADMNSLQHLLKQISWSSARVANPHRDVVYNDTEEKLEYCLAQYTGGVGGPAQMIKSVAQSVESIAGGLDGAGGFLDTIGLDGLGSLLSAASGALSGLVSIANTIADGIEKIEGLVEDFVRRFLRSFNRIKLDCDKSDVANVCGGGPSANAGGVYSYCVCCAEQSRSVNITLENGPIGGDGEPLNRWSLVDRIFYGTRGPFPPSISFNPLDPGNWSFDSLMSVARQYLAETIEGLGKGDGTALINFVTFFRSLYGDVLLSDKDGHFILKTMYPSYSVKQHVDILRNGCRGSVQPGGGDSPTGSNASIESKTFCPPGVAQHIKFGICPAFKRMLINWHTKGAGSAGAGSGDGGEPPQDPLELNRTSVQDFETWWLMVARGKALTAREIESALEMTGVKDIPAGPQRAAIILNSKRMSNTLESMCTEMAVAAFTYEHLAFKRTAEDFLALNRKATLNDKAQIMGLINRVGRQLADHQAHIEAPYMVEALMSGMNVEADRKKEGSVAAMAESMGNTQDFLATSRQWGGFGSIAAVPNSVVNPLPGCGGDAPC